MYLLFVIVCVAKIAAVNSFVSGPTPLQLIVPYETIVQYQCSVLVQEVPEEVIRTSWMWLINNTRYTLLSTRFNNEINMTESSNARIDVTEISLVTSNNKKLLEIACELEAETGDGSRIYFSGNTTATLLSFGQMSQPSIHYSSSKRELVVSWRKPESIADPSNFSYSVEVISTNNTVVQNTTTNTTSTTLHNFAADNNDCTEYYIKVTPIANGGIGQPVVTDSFIFPQAPTIAEPIHISQKQLCTESIRITFTFKLMPTCLSTNKVQYYIAESRNIGNSSAYNKCDTEMATITQVSPVSINGTTVTIAVNSSTTPYDIIIIANNSIGCDVSDPISLQALAGNVTMVSSCSVLPQTTSTLPTTTAVREVQPTSVYITDISAIEPTSNKAVTLIVWIVTALVLMMTAAILIVVASLTMTYYFRQRKGMATINASNIYTVEEDNVYSTVKALRKPIEYSEPKMTRKTNSAEPTYFELERPSPDDDTQGYATVEQPHQRVEETLYDYAVVSCRL